MEQLLRRWGIGAAIVIGALEGAFVIRPAGRLAELAERDLAATAVPAGGRRTSAVEPGIRRDVAALHARRQRDGRPIVVLTIFFMATHLGA